VMGDRQLSIDDEFELKGDLDKPILLQNIVHLYASTQSIKNHQHCCHIMPSEDQAVQDAKKTAISYATDWGSKLTPVSYISYPHLLHMPFHICKLLLT
jgi:hypothetical protein